MDKYITRKRVSKKYSYYLNNKKIINRDEIKRINCLRIPPGWKSVKISSKKNSKIQAMGIDAKKRPQYIYHKKFIKLRDTKRIDRLLNFIKQLDKMKNNMRYTLANNSKTCKKSVVCNMIKIILNYQIRIGNYKYTKQNNSFGVATLRRKHVIKRGNKMFLAFKGKSNKFHEIEITNSKIKNFINVMLKQPGSNEDNLFRYCRNKKYYKVNAVEVNEYLNKFKISTKDIRTYYANYYFIRFASNLMKNEKCKVLSETKLKKYINILLTKVSEKLRNTKAVVKKNYVIDKIVDYFHLNYNKFTNVKNIDSLINRIL